MKPAKLIISFGALSLLALSQAKATVIVTYAQDPGQETSTLVNSTMDTFNNITPGYYVSSPSESEATAAALKWNGVGTFTNLDILSANEYGGALTLDANGNPVLDKNGKPIASNYAVVGLGTDTKTTLNLNTPSSYFGMWWSAGDLKNVLQFWSGANGTGTLLAEFTTTNLMNKLSPHAVYPNGYWGNPNEGTSFYQQDSGEPFAFINFFGTPGIAWSSIVFTNNGSSGFEGDNYTSRVAAYDQATDGNMPGVVLEAINGTTEVDLTQAPEPTATLAMFLLGGLSFGGTFVRRFQKKK